MRGKKIMVVTLCVLLLFGTLSLASVSLGHQKALADEATFYSTASDGYLSKGDPTYNNAHIAPNAGYIANAITYIRVGQQLLTDYYIYRDALFFDTSSLPDNAVITSATLSLWGATAAPATDFYVTVVDGSSLNDPLVVGDYGYLGGQTTSGGELNTAGYSPGGPYNDIVLNAAGIGWISRTGMTKFGLRSSRDITSSAPSGDEIVAFSSNEEILHPPMLVVTYSIPPSHVPTLSQWGMIGMVILLAAFLACTVRKRRIVSASKS